MLNVINPANEEIVGDYNLTTSKQMEQILRETDQSFHRWSQKSIVERAKPMLALSQLLNEHKEKYAHLISREMGKPIGEARAEIKKCSQTCQYFATAAANLLKEQAFSNEKQIGIVSFEPLGVILGIMPWNFPFWQIFRFLAPTLMAGNGVVIKPALNVPGCAVAIEEVIAEAGFPPSLMRNLFVEQSKVHEIIEHPLVKAVSLTGSDRAGEAVGALAGKALKKCVLELGGSDPFIVLKDANLTECVKTAIAARLVNCGQSCIAAKRFIVVQPKIAEFCQRLIEGLKQVKMGDPLHEETTLGPLARKDLFEKFCWQVEDSIEKGAQLLLGGMPLERKGYFYPPTILNKVAKGMPAYDQETFGPLFAIIEAKDATEAIEIANDTPYGLGSSLWTQDHALAQELAKKIQAGLVFINGKTVSDPTLPFGGIKRSGFGRELAEQGIKEFVNVKTTVIIRD